MDAANEGDLIKVATGVYTDVHVRPRNDVTTTGFVTQVVYISKSLTIQGGYTTTNWTTPDPISYPTILDAQRRGRGLYVAGDPSAGSGQAISLTIEGLRLTGGDATSLGGYVYRGSAYDAGGGVYAITATLIISNIRVSNNTAELGGGLYLHKCGNAKLGANVISSNVAVPKWPVGNGGGLYLHRSSATLSDNTIIFNASSRYGGGLYLERSAANLNSNILSNSRSWRGGGLYLYYSDITLSKNTI